MTSSPTTRTAPLAGVRVLNLGGIWAGRVTSMLLADQGADVIEINRPKRASRPEDALLGRGKRIVTLDFTDPQDRAEAARLAAEADIVINNLGAGQAERFLLDHRSICDRNPSVVYLAQPGFPSGSADSSDSAWEGAISAAVGVFSDLNANAKILGDEPIYTALPMASAYGGVHGATVVMLAFLDILRGKPGQYVEVPLADALLSAMASLAMRVEGQPEQFDLPRVDKVMSDVAFPIFRDLAKHLTSKHKSELKDYLKRFSRPQFGHHRCADGRQVFINAADHVHQARACLETLGILDQLVAEGMVVGSPYDESTDGNNISSSTRLNPFWTRRLGTLMAKRFLMRPAHEWQAALQQAGVPCSVVRTTDEWLQEPVAHESGFVISLNDPEFGKVVEAGRFLTIEGQHVASPNLAPRQIVAGTISWKEERLSRIAASRGATNGSLLAGIRVLDIANVIAAPAAARTLAEFGADVIRIDAPAPQAGPRMTMWYGMDVNQGKRAAIIDLKSVEGRKLLGELVGQADVVLHNFLDRSASRIGLSPEQLRSMNPDIICCQVSAWGGPTGGSWKDFPAFDPVLQGATGITSRYGTPESPALHGIASCVDYITGFSAALGIAQALLARALGRGGSYVRTSLAMGAQLVQFPFVVQSDGFSRPAAPNGQDAKGQGAHQSLYETRNGWVFFACRSHDAANIARAIGAIDANRSGFEVAFASRSIEELCALLEQFPRASITPVRRLDALPVVDAADAITPKFGSMTLVQEAHPNGYKTAVPLPTWFRCSRSPVVRLVPAPSPGADTRHVLRGLKLSDAEIDGLIASGVVSEKWNALRHYLSR
jgi:crotonobetainyl-CoA:carnitine CoA-transferase CaiB-like acyl-CoA transferase